MIKKILKKVTAAVLSASLLAAALPYIGVSVFAENNAGKVRVIIENSTFTADTNGNAPLWTGVKVDEWVTLDDDSNGLNVVADAATQAGQTVTGADTGYITELCGLGAGDGGDMSGWMGTLNDWFTSEALSAYTVQNGKLADGDEIRMMYSLSWGADLGYDWSGTDKSLKNFEISGGELSPEFSADVKEYTLVIPEKTSEVTFRPIALNKAFEVKSTTGDKTLKISRPETLSDGDVITVTVGGDNIYTVTVSDNNGEDTAADSKRVSNVIALIAQIGEVTADSGEKITAARNAYDELFDELKARVTNAQTLFYSEEKYAEIIKLLADESRVGEIYAEMLEAALESEIVPLAETGGEWYITALARAGVLPENTAEKYYSELERALLNIENGRISHKATDNARVIIALCAMGKNPADVAGRNLLKGLDDYDFINKQGLMAKIFALIAFDCTDYNAGCREKLVSDLLDCRTPDGGWALMGDRADYDITAMAVQALAPYMKNERANEAVEAALAVLSNGLDDNCRYTTGSESLSQLIIAMSAVSADMNDARFVKNGISPVISLCSYYTEGGFTHLQNGEVNALATQQALLAVTAYDLSKDGNSLYDMDITVSDSTVGDSGNKENPPTGVRTACGAVVIISAAAVLTAFIKRRKK